jgi:CheY-like chemotaxis protein
MPLRTVSSKPPKRLHLCVQGIGRAPRRGWTAIPVSSVSKTGKLPSGFGYGASVPLFHMPGCRLSAQNLTFAFAKDYPTRPSILLADDDKAFRDALQKFLEPEFRIVASVGDGQALIEAAQALAPNVIIADISMPVLNGIQATRRLMVHRPSARVIFLTVHEEPAFVAEAKRSGARGYLLKRRAPDYLIPSIREVLQDGAFVCPTVLGEG